MKNRVTGIDLARALAIFGMVIVNYKTVMTASTGNAFLLWFADLFTGRASALFVILAGIGISFMTRKARQCSDISTIRDSRLSIIKRGGLLLIVGILYTPLWTGDILRLYGVYFLIASFLFMVSDKRLLWLAVVAIFVFPLMALFFDYNKGWYWPTLSYVDLLTWRGMLRNTFYNGFYPVFPWLAFLLYGMWLGRQDLADTRFRNKLLVRSLMIFIVLESVLYLIRMMVAGGAVLTIPVLDVSIKEVNFYMYSTVMPPLPLYVISAASSATIVLVACIYFSENFFESKISTWLSRTGRSSLTLYIAHVLIGMYFLNYIGRLENQTIEFALFSAFVFCISGILFSVLWLKYFRIGPLEWCFRKITN